MFHSLKYILKSKDLFQNWLSAGMKYLLTRYGLIKGDIVVKCDNEEIFVKPNVYRAIISAFYRRLFDKLECRNKGLYAIFTYKDRKVYLYNSFEFLYDIILENFFGGAYEDVDVINKTVLDIGAGVGDTAILFSLRGAKKVIAIEPYPNLFMIALTNIRINRLEDKILLLNAGIGSSDKEVCADANNVREYYIFRPGEKCDTKIRIYTLSSIIKDLNIEEDSVLKMDCEGCEYDTILHTDPQDLKIFKEIIIEYHNGYHELKRFLEDTGFNTKIKPIRSFPQPIEKQGYLIAKRNIR